MNLKINVNVAMSKTSLHIDGVHLKQKKKKVGRYVYYESVLQLSFYETSSNQLAFRVTFLFTTSRKRSNCAISCTCASWCTPFESYASILSICRTSISYASLWACVFLGIGICEIKHYVFEQCSISQRAFVVLTESPMRAFILAI